MASLGDIAIVGYGADAGVKSFAFVLLADLSGETITFTDNGWRAAGGFRTGEGTVSYTVPAGTPIGTVVTISGLTGSFNPSTTGDSIIAYVGDAANPTFLFAVDFADANAAYAGDATNRPDLRHRRAGICRGQCRLFGAARRLQGGNLGGDR
jgi:hypothetical protein